jgi:hypothetical protein
LRLGDFEDLSFAGPPRAYRAYHVSQVVPTDGVRTPLYTGGYPLCVGRPLKSPKLDPRSHFGSGAFESLKLRALTMRNAKASLTLSLPVILCHPFDMRLIVSMSTACFETPPLPVTPPSCRDRWHNTRAESQCPYRVQPYNLQPRVAVTTKLTGATIRSVRWSE